MDSGSLPPSITEPIIAAYAQGIRPAFAFILIPAIFSAMLVPLFIMLLTLSTPQLRRGPIFILNTAAICFGLILAVAAYLTAQMETILSSFRAITKGEDLVYTILDAWVPWLAEFVLLFRVCIVFPRAQLPFVLAFSVLLKIGRGVINILFTIGWAKGLFRPETMNQFEVLEQLNPVYFKLGYTLELLDNAYISALFLWRLGRTGRVFNSESIGRFDHKESYSDRLKNLFWIASTNFVFPIIFSVSQIATLFRGHMTTAAGLHLANCYVEIISTVFATIWSSTASFAEATKGTLASSIRFAQPRTSPGLPIELHIDQVISVTTDSLPIQGQEGKPGGV
ncbi:unnamed protein product [Mycena citricolor]|uniref:Uncharacterized protein n=1 Tax=Mycena citricolor TaxID=2018698 RepID=A0AAD2GTS2_9AGAR|nr:unnamed protein product [Mycena citricolor]